MKISAVCLHWASGSELSPAVPLRKGTVMAERSRRSFLQHGSLGAVAVGAVLAPTLAPTAASATPAVGPAAAGPLPEGPLIAYVKDHRTGDVSVMVGEHEVTHRDPELAAQLARIASHAPRG